jgi:hypothetical protein
MLDQRERERERQRENILSDPLPGSDPSKPFANLKRFGWPIAAFP